MKKRIASRYTLPTCLLTGSLSLFSEMLCCLTLIFTCNHVLTNLKKSNCPPSCSELEWSHLPKLWCYLSIAIYSLNHSSIETYKPNRKKYTEISVHVCVYPQVICREFAKFIFFFFFFREMRPVSNVQSEVLNCIDLTFVSK